MKFGLRYAKKRLNSIDLMLVRMLANLRKWPPKFVCVEFRIETFVIAHKKHWKVWPSDSARCHVYYWRFSKMHFCIYWNAAWSFRVDFHGRSRSTFPRFDYFVRFARYRIIFFLFWANSFSLKSWRLIENFELNLSIRLKLINRKTFGVSFLLNLDPISPHIIGSTWMIPWNPIKTLKM